MGTCFYDDFFTVTWLLVGICRNESEFHSAMLSWNRHTGVMIFLVVPTSSSHAVLVQTLCDGRWSCHIVVTDLVSDWSPSARRSEDPVAASAWSRGTLTVSPLFSLLFCVSSLHRPGGHRHSRLVHRPNVRHRPHHTDPPHRLLHQEESGGKVPRWGLTERQMSGGTIGFNLIKKYIL